MLLKCSMMRACSLARVHSSKYSQAAAPQRPALKHRQRTRQVSGTTPQCVNSLLVRPAQEADHDTIRSAILREK